MLLSKDKITEDIVDMLMKWRHSGFNVFCGPETHPFLQPINHSHYQLTISPVDVLIEPDCGWIRPCICPLP